MGDDPNKLFSPNRATAAKPNKIKQQQQTTTKSYSSKWGRLHGSNYTIMF